MTHNHPEMYDTERKLTVDQYLLDKAVRIWDSRVILIYNLLFANHDLIVLSLKC